MKNPHLRFITLHIGEIIHVLILIVLIYALHRIQLNSTALARVEAMWAQREAGLTNQQVKQNEQDKK